MNALIPEPSCSRCIRSLFRVVQLPFFIFPSIHSSAEITEIDVPWWGTNSYVGEMR